MATYTSLVVLGVTMLNSLVLSQTIPVVMWHGMGDSCCNPLSMGSIKRLIESNIKGIYVNSLEIGSNIVEDTENGFLMNVNDQVSLVCKKLQNDTNLSAGYNSIGFSQGGQFLRAVAQRCPSPPMLNLISVGGQQQGLGILAKILGDGSFSEKVCHNGEWALLRSAAKSGFQVVYPSNSDVMFPNDIITRGVYGFPRCPGDNETLCNIVRELLNYGAYVSFVQNHLVQAEYWQDPLNEEEYVAKSIFLADINQERAVNPMYKENLLKLKNLVLVQFLQDTMVQPRESEWFGFYKPGQAKDVLPMEQTKLWQEDRLGLQKLNATGRLHFLSSNSDHLQFTDTWFIQNILNKFLK